MRRPHAALQLLLIIVAGLALLGCSGMKDGGVIDETQSFRPPGQAYLVIGGDSYVETSADSPVKASTSVILENIDSEQKYRWIVPGEKHFLAGHTPPGRYRIAMYGVYGERPFQGTGFTLEAGHVYYLGTFGSYFYNHDYVLVSRKGYRWAKVSNDEQEVRTFVASVPSIASIPFTAMVQEKRHEWDLQGLSPGSDTLDDVNRMNKHIK